MKNSIFTIDRVDFFNLIIVRATNFILVATIFYLVRQNLDSSTFVEFGFRWSIGLLAGAFFFGGLGSTLVRFVSLYGGLGSIANQRGILWILLVALILTLVTLYLVINEVDSEILSFVIAVNLGAIIQLQMIIMALFRALQATRQLLIGSAVILLVIPSLFISLHSPHDSIMLIFGRLTMSYLMSLLILGSLVVGMIRRLAIASSKNVFKVEGFKESYLSFTMITVFSNVFVLLDFYLLREILPSDALNQAGVAKIYFDRFVIPILTVVTGLLSLNVLRSKTKVMVGNADFTISYNLNKKRALAVIPVLFFVTIGYYLFSFSGDSNVPTLGYFQAICVLLGYLCYSINSVFYDIFALKFGVKILFIGMLGYLVVSFLTYYLFISAFGLNGWVASCFLVNVMASFLFYGITIGVWSKR